LGIRAEHIKAWLRGAKKAEDPENGINHVGAGKTWDEFVELCSSVWAAGTICYSIHVDKYPKYYFILLPSSTRLLRLGGYEDDRLWP